MLEMLLVFERSGHCSDSRPGRGNTLGIQEKLESARLHEEVMEEHRNRW